MPKNPIGISQFDTNLFPFDAFTVDPSDKAKMVLILASFFRLRLTLDEHADNAAALAAGLVAGDLYRNGSDPDQVCIVH